MKIVKKIFIPATPQIFTPIRATTTSSYEVVELVRDKVDIPEPIAEEITETYEIPPDDEDVGNQYFYGEEEPLSRPYEQNSILILGDKWYNTSNGLEYTYLPEFEGSENLIWIPTGATGVGGGGIGEPWGITFPTKATNLEGIPLGTTFAIGTSATEILEKLLYPVFLEFTSFDIGITPKIYHIGDKSATGPKLAEWVLNDFEKAQENSLRIVQGSTTFPEASSLSPSDINVSINHQTEYTRNSEGPINFTISVTGESGETVSGTSSLLWRYPVYGGKTFGESLSTLTDLQSLKLSSPTPNNPILSYTMTQLKSGVTVSVPETPNDGAEYFYWLVVKEVNGSPVSPSPPNYDPFVGSFALVTNPNSPSGLPMEQIDDVTINAYGLSIKFNVYKSVFDIGGSAIIKILE